MHMARKQEADDEGVVQQNTMSYNNGDFDYAGLESIDRLCSDLYPDQLNPLQATALVKHWMGGPDPLDYISIYSNSGDERRGIPPHWHYITYGFSDLHGDGRVHITTGPGEPSGFGFELSMRLKKQETDEEAPMWAPNLMNRLAKYVFQTGNVLNTGDHIPWHRPLDGESDSKIRHMLITSDPELFPLSTQFGTVEFRQVVGVTDDEVKAAQRWKGAGVLQFFSTINEIGSAYITDMERQKSMFDFKPDLKQVISEAIEKEGSNLGHVTAICCWDQPEQGITKPSDSQKAKKNEGNSKAVKDSTDAMMKSSDSLEEINAVHLKFDSEAAELLPMVVKARLKKGRFFIFQNVNNHMVHLIPPLLHNENILVSEDQPLMSQGPYLQLYCSHQLIERMAQEFELLQAPSQVEKEFPIEFKFSDPSITVFVYQRGQLY